MSKDMDLLAGLANDQLEAEQAVGAAEGALKKAKERHRDIAERQIPEVMDRLQLEEFKTANGLHIKMIVSIRASVSKANMAGACRWLREHNHDKIIKHIIAVTPKSDDDAQRIARLLWGSELEDKASIHPQTLGAFVREKLENGEDVPLDLFGVFRQRASKVKVAT